MIRRMGGLGIGLLVLLTGCVTTEEADLIRSDIRKLKREIRQIRDEEGRRREAAQSAGDPLQMLKQELEGIRRIQADLENRLAQTRRDAAKATGSAEEQAFRARQIDQELGDLKARVETRISALEREINLVKGTLGFKGRTDVPPAPPAASAQPTPPGPPAAGPSPVTPVAPPLQPLESKPVPPPVVAAPPPPPPVPAVSADQKELASAMALFKAGKYQESRERFQELIRRFPTSPLADDAQYGIGETYFQEKRYDKAILEYDKVVINYAKGDKVPGALLKQGFAFLALGDKASAKQLLTQLINDHSGSPEAATARSRLANL